jgi:DNA-binding transcriptional ArsR family regulator
MLLIDQRDDGTYGVAAKELPARSLRAAGSALAGRIVETIAKSGTGMHASAVAKALDEPEQKVHYHIRRLRAVGILALDRVEESAGAATKVLRIASGAFCMRALPLEQMPRVGEMRARAAKALEPFVHDGAWNARIVVGSPDPHGPEGARSRDASYAVDLALFLGTFLVASPHQAVLLDTELGNWKQNLIIVGGPVVNKAAERVNATSPVPYDTSAKAFVSKRTRNAHASESAGIIARMQNPFSKSHTIMLLAGKRNAGTRAAVLALVRKFVRVSELLERNGAVVVEGVDADSDGVVDEVKILE